MLKFPTIMLTISKVYNSYWYVGCPSKHLGKTLIQMFHIEDLPDLELALWVMIQGKFIQKY